MTAKIVLVTGNDGWHAGGIGAPPPTTTNRALHDDQTGSRTALAGARFSLTCLHMFPYVQAQAAQAQTAQVARTCASAYVTTAERSSPRRSPVRAHAGGAAAAAAAAAHGASRLPPSASNPPKLAALNATSCGATSAFSALRHSGQLAAETALPLPVATASSSDDDQDNSGDMLWPRVKEVVLLCIGPMPVSGSVGGGRESSRASCQAGPPCWTRCSRCKLEPPDRVASSRRHASIISTGTW
jgi:hypothetical protein